MAPRICGDCGTNLNIVGDRHRCVGVRPAGQKPLTRLEAEKVVRGEMSADELLPKNRMNSQPVGRLAPRLSPKAPAPAEQPKADQTAAPPVSSSRQPTLADVLAGIDRLSAQFE